MTANKQAKVQGHLKSGKSRNLGKAKTKKLQTSPKKSILKTPLKSTSTRSISLPRLTSLARRLTMLGLFKKYYPKAYCALNYSNPYELLVATVLSAQCTDERVNLVTPALFEKYGTPEKMAKASLEKIEELIRSTGFYKNKARNLKLAAVDLVQKYQSDVPANLDQLVQLAGVGRKTANVVLGNAFGISSGIVVDTHVTRLSNRMGWVHGENAIIIERELSKWVPKEDWIMLPHYLIAHGRAICKARKPACTHCFLEETCPRKGV